MGFRAKTDVRPHTTTYVLWADFHVQYKDDDNAGIIGLLFTESASVLLYLSVFSLKRGPEMILLLSSPPPPQRKGAGKQAGETQCHMLCDPCPPQSEQKGSLGKDYFMMYPVVDPQSD